MEIAHMNIHIEVIPHQDHRYDTVGDWWFDTEGNLQIRVSQLGDWRFESLIAFHELAEVLQCKHKGITTEQVDRFDMGWKPHAGIEEPGDDPKAPYHDQHHTASNFELMLSFLLGVEWEKYADAIDALPEVKTK